MGRWNQPRSGHLCIEEERDSELGGLEGGSARLSEGIWLERQDWVTPQRVWNATLKNLAFIGEARDGKYVLHCG